MKFKLSYFLMLLGFVFLYMPMLVIIIFSFNASKLVTLWSGFSIKWYKEIWLDDALIRAITASLEISLLSASFGVILGCFAGIAIARTKFFSKTIFSFLLPTTLVMPEIITGFSFLILFGILNQYIGWPNGLGKATIIIAHITLCMSYVSLLIQIRLSELHPSIEEAALDLGATPFQVFLKITCPMIMPTIISGWLLSFTLSFDDLIISSFTTGPGTTTLPMLIYSRIKLGVNPEINVLGTILICLIIIIALIIYIFRKKNKLLANTSVYK